MPLRILGLVYTGDLKSYKCKVHAVGINLYGYCGENPVGWADPEGLFESSVDAFCRRFSAFCLELAPDLGRAEAGSAARASALRVLGDGDSDEAIMAERASQFIQQCVKTWGKDATREFGRNVHETLKRLSGGNGYKGEQSFTGVGRMDLLKGNSGVEWKPATTSGIQKGLEQVERYAKGGFTIDVVPYQVPWYPPGWDFVPTFFRTMIEL